MGSDAFCSIAVVYSVYASFDGCSGMVLMKKFPFLTQLSLLSSAEYTRKNYSLDIVKEALVSLDNPHLKLKNVVHITGTNGKGSTALYTASLLHEHCLKTGLYTSPHIFKVNERIMIGMKPVPDKVLENALKKVFSVETSQPLTYFEVLTCAMFLCFAEAALDAVILEVGLGGKLDATNVIENTTLSVITSISLDHTEVLGRTVHSIIKDKSGIIKKDSACLCGVQRSDIVRIVKKACLQNNAKFILWGKNAVCRDRLDFSKWETRFEYRGTRGKEKYTLPLVSLIQPNNAGMAIRIVEYLCDKKAVKKIIPAKINAALSIVIPARMQKLKKGCLEVIFDGGHNPAAVRNFVKTILLSGDHRMTIAVSLMREKESIMVFKELSRLKKNVEKICIYALDNSRAAKPEDLVKAASKFFDEKKIESYRDMNSLLRSLRDIERLYMIGSLYAMKELIT